MDWLRKQLDIYNNVIEPALRFRKFSQSRIPKYPREFTQPLIVQFFDISKLTDKYLVALRAAERYELWDVIKIFPVEGWYLSEDVIAALNKDRFLIETAENWDKKEVKEEFTRAAIQYLTDNLPEIEKAIIGISEKRENIISEIFKLHSEKRYYASIPLALAQIDGICKENFEMGFFSCSYGKKKPSEQKLKFKIQDCYLSFLLFQQISYDDKNELILIKSQNTKYSELNRHSIMHGESVEYANEINSVKTILLLDFIRNLVKSIE